MKVEAVGLGNRAAYVFFERKKINNFLNVRIFSFEFFI